MLTDYWAHQYSDNPKLLERIEDEDFDVEAEIARLDQDPDAWEEILG